MKPPVCRFCKTAHWLNEPHDMKGVEASIERAAPVEKRVAAIAVSKAIANKRPGLANDLERADSLAAENERLLACVIELEAEVKRLRTAPAQPSQVTGGYAKKEARKAYQRDLMRRKREAAKAKA